MHTARFYNVNGSMGVRNDRPHDGLLHCESISLFRQSAAPDRRRQLQDDRRLHDQLPSAPPDWQLISHAITVGNGRASTSNIFFKLFGVPIFYVPYLRHPVERDGTRERAPDSGRE